MGTMNFCVEAAVEEVGGEGALEPGDIVLYNDPYRTGTHPQDAALVMPVFLDDGVLVGYTTIKGHWLDIAGKEPYSTDTVDVFQEGTVYPGVKLYSGGQLVEDVWRTIAANTRGAQVGGRRRERRGGRGARRRRRPGARGRAIRRGTVQGVGGSHVRSR